MSTVRELKRRIKTINSTQQVTKAMKMVSVAKYNKSLARYNAFRAYQVQCQHLTEELGGLGMDLPEGRSIQKVCYVVVTGNRGLCGSYNQDVLRALQADIKKQTLPYTVLVCGKWGAENAKNLQPEVYPISDIPTWGQANALGERLRQMFISGEADEIFFVYQRFRNVLSQLPVVERFLPKESKPADQSEEETYLYIPDRTMLERALMVRLLNAEVYGVLLSASTGVHGSMMMSMRTASENSETMLDDLSLKLNRIRQSSVTTQVLEISSSSVRGEEG